MTTALMKDSIEQHALGDLNNKQYVTKGKLIKGFYNFFF